MMTIKSVTVPERIQKLRQNVHVSPSIIIWLAVLGLLFLAGTIKPSFLEITHLLNVTRQASALGILAIGQTFVLITGGIDLSNGMVITLVNVVAATLLRGSDENLVVVIAICLLIGAIVGLANGLIITRLRVPPLVVTLGMFNIVRGLAYVYTEGAPKGEISPGLEFVGSGFVENVPIVGRVPTAIFFWLVFTLVGVIILRRTIFGRQLFAVGGNDKASRLSGVRANRVVILAYVSSGLTAAVAGLILSGYIGTGSLGIGDGFNLDSIAASVVGGTALSGGIGTVVGTAGGAVFIAMLISFLRFIGWPYTIQLMMQGVILAIAAYAHVRSRR